MAGRGAAQHVPDDDDIFITDDIELTVAAEFGVNGERRGRRLKFSGAATASAEKTARNDGSM